MKRDFEELSAKAAAGKPLYGEVTLDEFTQTVAAGNSRYSQLIFSAFPW